MTAATITDALARHWTRDPQKLRELVRDTWFLEVAEQLVDTTPDAAAVGRGLATLLVKPDGIATGSARTVVDWLGETGFVIRDAVAVTMDPNGIRALWYHQWNIASGERRMLADLLCGLSPALLLVVGREPAGVGRPCAVVLTERKGPTAPDRRRPEHLRGRLPGGSYLLNQVHTADEPADALRELGVYLTTRRRQVCLDRVAAGHDATGEAARIADDLDARYGGHTTDPGPAWAALADSRLPDESDAGLCGRLLRAADPVPGHLTWPLIVAGAECLPMRTPGGSVVLATPPATAWDGPAGDTPARVADGATVDRALVHRRAVAETFATGVGPALLDGAGRRVVPGAVQLARLHPVYTDHVGTQRGLVDLLHLMEAVRQVCIAAGQQEFGAGSRDVFVVRDFCAEFAHTPPRLDDVPLDLFPRITAMREHRPRGGGPVTGLDVEIGIDDRDRREIARSRGSFSWGPRADFAQLREGMRDALGLGGTPVAAPRPRPVGPDEVQRHDPRNAVLSPDPGDGPGLVVDTSHAVYFDHPLDHVPGMLQIEGARQAALLSLDPADRPRAVATRVRSRFLTVAELDLPVTVRAADPGPDGDVRVEVLQTGRAVADIAVTLDTGGPG